MSDAESACVACGAVANGGVCSLCKSVFSRSWYVGSRVTVLKQIIDDYKFNRKRSVANELTAMLDDILPSLPNNVIVTCVPTAPPHMRRRGYDHTMLIAKGFARSRGLSFAPTLTRNHSRMQRGASKSERRKQAQTAFRAREEVHDAIYLLVDDIYTTGASVEYASRRLLEAGAKEVWVAVLAKEPRK